MSYVKELFVPSPHTLNLVSVPSLFWSDPNLWPPFVTLKFVFSPKVQACHCPVQVSGHSSRPGAKGPKQRGREPRWQPLSDDVRGERAGGSGGAETREPGESWEGKQATLLWSRLYGGPWQCCGVANYSEIWGMWCYHNSQNPLVAPRWWFYAADLWHAVVPDWRLVATVAVVVDPVFLQVLLQRVTQRLTVSN